MHVCVELLLALRCRSKVSEPPAPLKMRLHPSLQFRAPMCSVVQHCETCRSSILDTAANGIFCSTRCRQSCGLSK